MRKFALGLCLLALASICNAAILVSTQGVFSDPNQIFEQSFNYNPATQGGTLVIQTYGYGGSAAGNAIVQNGRNAAGLVISPGGFDPIIGLFNGAAGAGGTLIASNDDGTCSDTTPGALGTRSAGNCFDSTLIFTNLAAGQYTVSLSVFPAFPPATENGAYSPGAANFSGRTAAFAIDVTATPEPMTFGLMGAGLLGLGLLRRRLKK